MSPRALRLRRLRALWLKEALQIVRDPSTLLIALVFPLVLLCIFGFGVNMDTSVARLGVVVQDAGPPARRLAQTLAASRAFQVEWGHSVEAMGDRVRAGAVRGFVVIRADFSERLARGDTRTPTVLLVTDGAEPSSAGFVAANVRGAFAVFQREELRASGRDAPGGSALETRVWFNPAAESRNSLLPGSITIIMTVVGALLTALVVAREWERGTMEALLAAGVTRFELIACKLVPYFVLGMGSFVLCVGVTAWGFGVPLRGSLPVLLLVGATFLGSALGLGLLLSTTLRSQYNAAQAALNAAFLPALMLSGLVFEIASMPAPIRAVTVVIPARYFVAAMQTLFQAGDVWPVLSRALFGLALAAVGFIGAAFLATRRRLE